MNKNITSPSGLKLLTAGKYCAEDIQVTPVLQEKTATENGEYTVDNGYSGLSKVTVNVASGAELNIAYGDTAPEDTTKLWVNGEEPLKVVANNQLGGSESIELLSASFPSGSESARCASVGNYVYLFGITINGTDYNTIYKFNTITKELTTLSTTLPTAIQEMGCASVGTNIYLFGGRTSSNTRYNTILKFDTTTETITTLSVTLPVSITSTSCASVGTKIYLFGGYTGSYTSAIYKFDTTTETIEKLSIYLYLSVGNIGCASVGTKIYLFGGDRNSGKSNAIQIFDTTTETITTLSVTLPNQIGGMGCASVGNYVYLFGGFGASSPYYPDAIYKFDITTETIETLSIVIPNGFYNGGCASVGTNIYLFSGQNANGRFSGIYEFPVSVALTANHLLLNTTLDKNLFKLINAETAEIEIGVNAVYRGNASGVAEQETACIFDESQSAWVDVQSGAVVQKVSNGLINFTVDGVTYEAEEGMTWEAWINSEYNTDGFTSNGGGDYVYAPSGKFVFDCEGCTIDNANTDAQIFDDETIIADHAYYSMTGGF